MSTKICSKCNSHEVKKILFGEVGNDPGLEKYYLKGCVIDCDCIWHCMKCHYEWGANGGHYKKSDE